MKEIKSISVVRVTDRTLNLKLLFQVDLVVISLVTTKLLKKEITKIIRSSISIKMKVC